MSDLKPLSERIRYEFCEPVEGKAWLMIRHGKAMDLAQGIAKLERELEAARAALKRVGAVVAANGCDCDDCEDNHTDRTCDEMGHEPCWAHQIDAALAAPPATKASNATRCCRCQRVVKDCGPLTKFDRCASCDSDETPCRDCVHVRFQHSYSRGACTMPACGCAGFREPAAPHATKGEPHAGSVAELLRAHRGPPEAPWAADVLRANAKGSGVAGSPQPASAGSSSAPEPASPATIGDTQIEHMVSRFLGWRLPENFSPDAGISFKAAFNEGTPYPMKHEPIGTNLFDAAQAEAMVRHMIDGMPAAPGKMEATPLNQCDGCRAGVPVDEHGNHRMGKEGEYGNLQACERRKYESPQGATALERAIEGLDTLAERWGEAGGFCTPGDMVRHCSALADLLIAAQREQEELRTAVERAEANADRYAKAVNSTYPVQMRLTAERDAARAELVEIKASFKATVDGKCAGDELHCSCVPALRAEVERLKQDRADAAPRQHLPAQEAKPEPIPVRLPCPSCGELHIDVGEFATKVHHTHSCQHCGMTWRPAVAPTVGVRFLPGFKNVDNEAVEKKSADGEAR